MQKVEVENRYVLKVEALQRSKEDFLKLSSTE